MAGYVEYSPKTWGSREFITKDAMNKIEQGIAAASQKIIEVSNNTGSGSSGETNVIEGIVYNSERLTPYNKIVYIDPALNDYVIQQYKLLTKNDMNQFIDGYDNYEPDNKYAPGWPFLTKQEFYDWLSGDMDNNSPAEYGDQMSEVESEQKQYEQEHPERENYLLNFRRRLIELEKTVEELADTIDNLESKL